MSLQDDHRILVASVAAYDQPPASSRWLIESCRRQGITLTLLGQGQSYPNNFAKPRLVAHYLRDHPVHRFVLAVDFRDTVFCASLEETFGKYLSFGHEIVASTEPVCWPLGSTAPRFPETGTPYRFLNSGVIFATREAWLAAWERMCEKERRSSGLPPERGQLGLSIFDCDQAAWSDLYLNKEADIVLDSRCEISQTLGGGAFDLGTANPRFLFEGRRIVNRDTGGRPCVIHSNSGSPVASWARYVLDPPVAWYWPLLDLIRHLPLRELRDASRLESLVLRLGLHEPVDADVPAHLLPYSGKGLAIRRRSGEMAAFLAWLASRPPVGSYVEVGCGNGGAFLATVEFLRRLRPIDLALGVGPDTPPLLLDYVSRVRDTHYIRGRRARDGLESIAKRDGHVDLVVIDACQPDSDPVADWEYARSCGRYVVLHGIASAAAASARPLWETIQAKHHATREFVDRQLTAETQFGLGVVDLAYS
ncbi:MAG TPA: hypothetical protein VKA15_01710 [Isosphaeraceae bacterium]|nr:hypothetical protein [Isosphaeraceae bacterium]